MKASGSRSHGMRLMTFAKKTCGKLKINTAQKRWYSDRVPGVDAGGPLIFLAYAYGSPNWTLFGLSGNFLFTPRLAAMHTISGDITFPDASQFSPLRYKDPEWDPPKCMIHWARGIRGSQCTDHYFSGHWVVDLLKQGTKLTVVDPSVFMGGLQSRALASN